MEFSEPTGGITVGPILLGASKPAHILTQTATVRGILNMTARPWPPLMPPIRASVR